MTIISCTCNLGKHQALFDALSENLNRVIVERDKLRKENAELKAEIAFECLDNGGLTKNELVKILRDGNAELSKKVGRLEKQNTELLSKIEQLEKYAELGRLAVEVFEEEFACRDCIVNGYNEKCMESCEWIKFCRKRAGMEV